LLTPLEINLSARAANIPHSDYKNNKKLNRHDL